MGWCMYMYLLVRMYVCMLIKTQVVSLLNNNEQLAIVILSILVVFIYYWFVKLAVTCQSAINIKRNIESRIVVSLMHWKHLHIYFVSNKVLLIIIGYVMAYYLLY